MPEPMTLLQRAVLQRLTEAGHIKLAHHARLKWTAGLQCDDAANMIDDEMLRADFERANSHARAD